MPTILRTLRFFPHSTPPDPGLLRSSQTPARSLNAINGAVSGLSPYITHSFVTLLQVLEGVSKGQTRDVQHKFVYELDWRECFRHVW